MSLYLIARLAHIVAMLLTLGLTMAAEPMFLSAARAASLEQMEQRFRLALRLLGFTQFTMLVGLLAGVALVFIVGWSPLSPWLVASYGLLGVMSVFGRIGTTAWQQHMQSALLRPTGGSATLADVRSVLTDRRALLARLAVITIFLTIMALMRTKPTFGL